MIAVITTNSNSLIFINENEQRVTLAKSGLKRFVIKGNSVIMTNGYGGRIGFELGTTIDGEDFDTLEALQDKLSSFSKGGGTGEGVQWDDTSMLPVGGKVPVWSSQGLLSTGMPQFPENCVPLIYLDLRMDNLTLLRLTQEEYDDIAIKNPNTLYIINE